MKPWVCPKCGRVYGPLVTECHPCNTPKVPASNTTPHPDPAMCPSTHGGSGYAPGSYWRDDAIICGQCGKAIMDPPPIAHRGIRQRVPGWRGWLLRRYVVRLEPRWPDWIAGERRPRDHENRPVPRLGHHGPLEIRWWR